MLALNHYKEAITENDPEYAIFVRMRKMAQKFAYKWSHDDASALAEDLEQAGWEGYLQARNDEQRFNEAWLSMLHAFWLWKYGTAWRGSDGDGRKMDWDNRPRVTANAEPLDYLHASQDVEREVGCKLALEKIHDNIKSNVKGNNRFNGIDSIFKVWIAAGDSISGKRITLGNFAELAMHKNTVYEARKKLRTLAKPILQEMDLYKE